MTVNDIVNELARNKEVEKIIDKITDGRSVDDPSALDDLTQDIYVSLLDKGDKLIEVYEQGHILFYLTRMVMNNIISSSSPYYRTYLYPRVIGQPINDNILTGDGTAKDQHNR